MPRPGGTTARGYGHAHRQARAALLAALTDGDPCCRCGRPMYRSQPLHADHHARAVALGGDLPDALAHARCNLQAGARLGNRMRGLARARSTALPSW